MLVVDPIQDPKPQEIYLPVESITLNQPLHVVVNKVATLKAQGKDLISQIENLDANDTTGREKLQKQLTSVQNDLTRWGVPLFARLPYKYPPATFSLSD